MKDGPDTHCQRKASQAQECQRGVALLEWLWAMSIALILMVAGIPMAQGAWQSMQSASVSESLVRALRLTQQEALSRSARVTLAPSPCDVSSTTHWACPWVIFIDVGGDRGYDAGSDALIKTLTPPFNSRIAGTKPYVTFGPLGTTPQVQSFLINDHRRVTLSWARISVSTDQ